MDIECRELADKMRAEAEMPLSDRWSSRTLFEQLSRTAASFPDRPALAFQLTSGPTDPVSSLTWAELRGDVIRTANLFRKLGIGPEDVVAYILPNGIEAPITLIAGATAGIVNPVNPLLSVEHIAGILPGDAGQGGCDARTVSQDRSRAECRQGCRARAGRPDRSRGGPRTTPQFPQESGRTAHSPPFPTAAPGQGDRLSRRHRISVFG